MTEELEQQAPDTEVDVVNEEVAEQVQEAPRTVPLEALEAERRKRQDLEAQNRALQDLMMKSKAPQAEAESDDDEDEFITKAEMKKRLDKVSFTQKRELLEEAFCDNKPEAVDLINTHLENIIKRKPWLAQTIESAPNRYARAYEIVQDYMPIENKVAPAQKFSRPQAEAKRIVENAQKPGNPSTIAKATNGSNLDYLKSIQGKPEFQEYRRKMLAGR
jgi:hypothetical protein